MHHDYPCPVRVALAQFEDIVAHNLSWLIGEDENLEPVAAGMDHDHLVTAQR